MVGAIVFVGLTVLDLGRVFQWTTLVQVTVIAALLAAFAVVARSWGRPISL